MEHNIMVTANYVLVKMTMTAKKGKIILANAVDDRQKFDFSSVIEQVGPACKRTVVEDGIERSLKIGDNPILGKHANISPVREMEKTEQRMVHLAIVHEEDIMGIDNTPIVALEDVNN